MTKFITAAVAASTIAMAGGDIVVESTPVPFTGAYIGGGLTIPQTYVDGEKSFFEDDINNETGVGVGGNLGYVFYNTGDWSVAVEGRAAISVASYDITPFDADTYNYGVYLKPEVYFDLSGYKFGAYALAGWASVTVEDDFDSEDTDGFAYGLGGEYFATETLSVFVDYTMLPAFDTDVDGINVNNDQFMIGINYRW